MREFLGSVTVIEAFEFIAGNLRVLHALEYRLHPRIFFTPEVVGDYQVSVNVSGHPRFDNIHDVVTVGPSATVPGILLTAAPAAPSAVGAKYFVYRGREEYQFSEFLPCLFF